MKFFIPSVESSEQAEELYEGTRKFASQTTGSPIGQARIRSITFKDRGQKVHATVGERESWEGDVVIAIPDSNSYFACTPNRGVLRGVPFMVGKDEVSHVEEFEPETDSPQ